VNSILHGLVSISQIRSQVCGRGVKRKVTSRPQIYRHICFASIWSTIASALAQDGHKGREKRRSNPAPKFTASIKHISQPTPTPNHTPSETPSGPPHPPNPPSRSSTHEYDPQTSQHSSAPSAPWRKPPRPPQAHLCWGASPLGSSSGGMGAEQQVVEVCVSLGMAS